MARRASVPFDSTKVATNTIHPELFTFALAGIYNEEKFRILVDTEAAGRIHLPGSDANGDTILHFLSGAADRNGICVHLLVWALNRGMKSSIHIRNNHGQTAAMVAARMHHWAEMEVLVGEGSDLLFRSSSETMTDYVRGAGKWNDSVWDSCRHANVPEALEALHRGLDVAKGKRDNNDPDVPPEQPHSDSTFRCLLFKAAHARDMRTLQYLIEERKVDVNLVDLNEQNVLHWIASDTTSRMVPVAKYLVEQGCNMHVANSDKQTPALVAARSHAWPMMQFLVSMGSSFSRPDKDGQTIWMYVASFYKTQPQGKKALDEAIVAVKSNPAAQSDPFDSLDERGPVVDRPIPRVASIAKLASVTSPPVEKQPMVASPIPRVASLSPRKPEPVVEVHSEAPAAAPVLRLLPLSPRVATAIKQATPSHQPLPHLDAAVLLETSVAQFMGPYDAKVTKDTGKEETCFFKPVEAGVVLQISTKSGLFGGSKVEEKLISWPQVQLLGKIGTDGLKFSLGAEYKSVAVGPIVIKKQEGTFNQVDDLEDFVWMHVWKHSFQTNWLQLRKDLIQFESHSDEPLSAIAILDHKKMQMGCLVEEVVKFRKQISKDDDKKADLQFTVDTLTKQISERQVELDTLVKSKATVAMLKTLPSLQSSGDSLVLSFNKLLEALANRVEFDAARLKRFQAHKKLSDDWEEHVKLLNQEVDNINRQKAQVESDLQRAQARRQRIRDSQLHVTEFQ